MLGHERLWEEPWPSYDPALLERETFELVIQVNGRVRDRVEISTIVIGGGAGRGGQEVRSRAVLPGRQADPADRGRAGQARQPGRRLARRRPPRRPGARRADRLSFVTRLTHLRRLGVRFCCQYRRHGAFVPSPAACLSRRRTGRDRPRGAAFHARRRRRAGAGGATRARRGRSCRLALQDRRARRRRRAPAGVVRRARRRAHRGRGAPRGRDDPQGRPRGDQSRRPGRGRAAGRRAAETTCRSPRARPRPARRPRPAPST